MLISHPKGYRFWWSTYIFAQKCIAKKYFKTIYILFYKNKNFVFDVRSCHTQILSRITLLRYFPIINERSYAIFYETRPHDLHEGGVGVELLHVLLFVYGQHDFFDGFEGVFLVELLEGRFGVGCLVMNLTWKENKYKNQEKN